MFDRPKSKKKAQKTRVKSDKKGRFPARHIESTLKQWAGGF